MKTPSAPHFRARFAASLALLCLLGAAPAKAQYRSMVVGKADNTTLTVSLQAGMTTTFADGILTLGSTKGNITLALTDITGWTYSTQSADDTVWTGIDGVAAADTNAAAAPHISADAVTLSGLAAATVVRLVSQDGAVVRQCTATGTLCLPLSGLAAGVYVLQYNKNAIKIAVK